MFSHLSLVRIAFMEIEPILKGQTFTGADGNISYAFWFVLEVMHSERVGCEQSVITNVPPGRMFRVLRMVENGNAYDFIFHRPVIIAPGRRLTPGFFVAMTLTVENMSFSDFPFESHCGR